MVFTCDLTECLNCGVRVGQQYVEGRKGACFEALSINSLSSASNVDFAESTADHPLTLGTRLKAPGGGCRCGLPLQGAGRRKNRLQ